MLQGDVSSRKIYFVSSVRRGTLCVCINIYIYMYIFIFFKNKRNASRGRKYREGERKSCLAIFERNSSIFKKV